MAGVTWTYTYDDAGNLRTKQLYPYSEGSLGSLVRTYTLGYNDSDLGDLQTHWCGEAFTTDAIGNLTYDGDIYYTWEHGRELTRMEYGSTVWDITYDANGMRVSRSNGTRTYNYTYNGSQLSRMTVDGHTLDFTYDSSGRPLSVTYDGTPYFYVLSLQGDVMAILDSSGTAVVSYTYSAYGSSTYFSGSMRDTLGYYNPLRYRGYVYDPEYGLYYLQSRYYNTGLSRFNAPDAFTSTGQGLLGNNMFAYCNNNPVMFTDAYGCSPSYYPVCLDDRGRQYITDQNDSAIGDKQFGLATVAHGGCGVIASYNALITLGSGKDFDDVLAYYNSKMLFTVGYGFMGLLHHDVANYFASLGYTVVVTWNPGEVDKLSQSADACIMYYEFDHTYNFLGFIPIDAYGAHFIEYHISGDGYRGVNTSSNSGISTFTLPSEYGHLGMRYHCVGIFIYK